MFPINLQNSQQLNNLESHNNVIYHTSGLKSTFINTKGEIYEGEIKNNQKQWKKNYFLH